MAEMHGNRTTIGARGNTNQIATLARTLLKSWFVLLPNHPFEYQPVPVDPTELGHNTGTVSSCQSAPQEPLNNPATTTAKTMKRLTPKKTAKNQGNLTSLRAFGGGFSCFLPFAAAAITRASSSAMRSGCGSSREHQVMAVA